MDLGGVRGSGDNGVALASQRLWETGYCGCDRGFICCLFRGVDGGRMDAFDTIGVSIDIHWKSDHRL